MERKIIVPMSQVKILFYIRVAQEPERVRYFEELRLGLQEVKPIDVMPGDYPDEYVLLDGRHRMAAYQNLGDEEIEVVVHPKMTQEEAIAFSFRVNFGGALPPGDEDIIHMIDVMIRSRMNKETINEALKVMPKRMIDSFHRTAKKRIINSRIRLAIERIGKMGENTEQATIAVNESFPIKITPAQVNTEILRREKTGKDYKPYFEKMEHDLGQRFRSFNKANNKLIKELFQGYVDSKVDAKKVRAILGHFGKLMGAAARACNDAQKRFELRAFDVKEALFDKPLTTRGERRKYRKSKLFKIAAA